MDRVIVTSVDGSAAGRTVADWAAREALRRGLPLRVVQVVRGDDRPEAAADQVAAELLAQYPSLTVRGVRVAGAAASVLCSVSSHAEMVVLGATATEVVGGACPVVLVPVAPSGGDGVVVGVDSDGATDGVLRFAFEAARLYRVRLRAVRLGRRDGVLGPWRAKFPDVEVVEDVEDVVPPAQAADGAGLLVVGRRVGRDVVGKVRCPVAVVPD